MAADTERSIRSMQESLRLWSEDMTKAEKSSRGIAQNFDILHRQIDSQHLTMMSYLKAVVQLPKPFEEISKALVTPRARMVTFMNFHLEQLRLAQAAGERDLSQYKAAVALEVKRIQLKDALGALTGKHLAIEYILIRSLADAIKRSGEMNEALMQANSLTKVRTGLTRDINEVQAKTGASLQNMLGATKALVNVWPKGRSDFKATLETIVQMEEGLGVSFENSAELARIFQINLKTPVRDVADQIAVIANSTSLAADEATRFATEVGKALRLLGPGAAPGAREVSGYVTMIAARMKDVGGDASEIIKMFSEMTKGTSQGFMLRGMSGVNTPGALGTQAGAQQALQGIGRMIDRIVTAAPGTAAYSAQLETAAQIMGTSTDTIRLYRDMLKEANKPLDEHAKLQQRWQEQIVNANKAIQRVREAFVALIQQALTPLIGPLAWFLGIIAKIVTFIASNEITVTIAMVVIGAAIAKTIVSVYRLTAAIFQLGIASDIVSKTRGIMSTGLSVGTIGSAVNIKQFQLLSKVFGQTAGQFLAKSFSLGSLTSLRSLFATGPIAAVVAAGAAGWTLGKLIDERWPNNWIHRLSKAYADTIYKAQYASISTYQKPGEKPLWEIMADVRKAALRGNMEEAMKIFEENKYKVSGLQTEKGAKGYLDAFIKTMAEVRETMALSTVTADEAETLERDRSMIDLTKKQLNNSDEYLKRVRDYEQRTNARYEAARADQLQQRIINDAKFRMMNPKNMPSKASPGMPFVPYEPY